MMGTHLGEKPNCGETIVPSPVSKSEEIHNEHRRMVSCTGGTFSTLALFASSDQSSLAYIQQTETPEFNTNALI